MERDPCRKGSISIRNIKLLDNSNWRFDLSWHTSVGEVKTIGWLWIPGRNLLRSPGVLPVIKLSELGRRQLRNLFTQIMKIRFGIIVKPLKGRVEKDYEHTTQVQEGIDIRAISASNGIREDLRIVSDSVSS
jgi:hypothetical protein